MDLPSHKLFSSPSKLPPPPGDSKMSLYGKTKENPFADDFPDPLCKLNLKETSEFVKSLPMPNAENRAHSVSQQRRLLESPSTPGRPHFTFSSGLPRKSFPSKWDDAEKWLMSTSCHDSPAHNNVHKVSEPPRFNLRQPCFDDFKQQQPMHDFSEKSRVTQERVSNPVPDFHWPSTLDHHHNTLGVFHGASDTVLKDKFTDSIVPILPTSRYLEPSKEGFLFRNQQGGGVAMQNASTEMVQHRDVGTEMTPLGSSTTSRCPTPYDLVVPWSSSEEEEIEISKSLRHNASHIADSDYITAAWEEEERTKCCLRYQREEAKIQAWVNLQNAKAEARSRKLEVKIQKMRSNLEEKLMKKMSVVHRKAEEWRAEARQQHSEQFQKAQKMIHKHNSQFSRPSSCGCFPCNNNHH
ncbi:hypothetical protein Fmac_010791 [Flemingia macrophylla]|uniref:Remorin C-terminal domain-containing protein n=1 Tax=Flemingia macrophylla TaxID=520843 RepID=A0ABD1MKK2_9FABA